MPDDLWDDRWDRGGDASAGERPQIQMELLWLTLLTSCCAAASTSLWPRGRGPLP